MNKIMAVEEGEQMPLSGGWELDIPPGVFRAPNLTPDPETGIGKLTDGEIARVLRYSVAPDGRFIAPFMPFQELSDEDLTAIISFLRSQEPVRHEVRQTEINFLGRALMAFGALEPRGPQRTPPNSVRRDSTAVYGEYLAKSVGNCFGCHTELDMKTGKNIGPPFAGGSIFGPDEFSKGMVYVSPNLTPDKGTGIMADWDEELFIDRFRGGRIYKGSPMPWGAFSRMNETDLKALFHYLKSVKPVARRIEEIVYDPESK